MGTIVDTHFIIFKLLLFGILPYLKLALYLQVNTLANTKYKYIRLYFTKTSIYTCIYKHIALVILYMYASISADIVSSTSLTIQSMIELNDYIKEIIRILESRYNGFWGRIVRGDTIECVLERPETAFEIAIILKSWVKGFKPSGHVDYPRFSKYGLRLAIGIGEMNIVERDLDMMDGDAIYRSGRSLDKLKGRSKYSMTISMSQEEYEEPLNIILSLVNQILNNATSRKCLTLCERILSATSNEAADKMGITVSGVNQTLNELGWSNIKQAIKFYHKTISNLNYVS